MKNKKYLDLHLRDEKNDKKLISEPSFLEKSPVSQKVSAKHGKRKFLYKKIKIIFFTVFLFLISVFFIYIWQKIKVGGIIKLKFSDNLNNAESKIKNNKILEENIWDIEDFTKNAQDGEEVLNKNLILKSESNIQESIIKLNLVNNNREKIFDFNLDNFFLHNNLQTDAENVTISPDGKQVAYISNEGLNLYDLGTKEKKIIIKKEKQAYINLEISPEWSVDCLRDAYALKDVKWSPSGKYLSFTEIFPDNFSLGIINLENGDCINIKNREGGNITGQNMRWSQSLDFFISPEFYNKSQSGLFISSVEKFGEVENLAEKFKLEGADFFEVETSPDSRKIIFTYNEKYDEDNNNVMAITESNGQNFSILSKKGNKTSPFFSYDEKNILYITDLTEDTVVLSLMNIEKEETDISVILPKYYNFWYNPLWIDQKYLAIFGKALNPLETNENKSSILLILDINNRKIIKKIEFEKNIYPIGFLPIN